MAGVLLFLALPARLPAQPALSTILSNGPTAKRINIVVLSEGYTTNDLVHFPAHAAAAVSNLLSQPPYQPYRDYFNAFAISVASAQSGSDHPNYPFFVDTYFNSSFYSHGVPQLLTIPPNNFDGTYANGQGKVDALLATFMPEYDLVMLVVNDPEYGGSGGPTLITSLHLNSPEVVRHESGHTFGGLTDEYADPFPGYTPIEKPNATQQTNRALIKWTSWIFTNTPLPTPAVASNAAVVGLFEGAQYRATGWYRPKLNCKMRNLGTNFCEVCSEQLVKTIYALIRPIDAFTPAATNFSVFSPQPLDFTVSPLQPLSHHLAVQWYTNDVAVSGATNVAFSLLPATLSAGTNRVMAVVRDPTPFVRNDPSGLLRQTNNWTLNVSLNELSLVSAQYLAGHRFRLTVTGTAPQGFVLQASPNLTAWTSLATSTLSGGKYDYTNTGLTNVPHRFYRTRSPP